MPFDKYRNTFDLSEVLARQSIDIEAAQAALFSMHRNVVERATSIPNRQVEAHNRRTNVVPTSLLTLAFVISCS